MRQNIGAVIGLGYWGPNLIRNFVKTPHVRIKKACDLSNTSIIKFKNEYPTIAVTKDYTEILNDREIEFVAIATPLKTHYALAKEALIAGKHILIEKPMTQTIKEAEELIKISKKNKKILMVGHTFVYSPAVNEIKKIIMKKSFGEKLYFDSTRINLGRFASDTDVVWDLAPHDLSILNYLLGELPTKVQAVGSSHISKNIIELAHIFLRYKNDISAHISVSWLSPVKIRTILMGGSKQMIVYNDIEPSEKIKIYDKSVTIIPGKITPFTPAYRSGNVTIPYVPQTEALYIQIKHFIDCIEKKKNPITNAYEGLKVVEILVAIEQSIKTNSEVNL